MIIIMTKLKCAIQDFYNLLTAQLCENHVQHIERLSRATWFEGTAQLFILALFSWLKSLADEGKYLVFRTVFVSVSLCPFVCLPMSVSAIFIILN